MNDEIENEPLLLRVLRAEQCGHVIGKVMCEACEREPAVVFAGHRDKHKQPQWQFKCFDCSRGEYLMFLFGCYGSSPEKSVYSFFDTPVFYLAHLMEEDWVDFPDFVEMMRRLLKATKSFSTFYPQLSEPPGDELGFE